MLNYYDNHNLEQSDVIQLVLPCQNMNDSIVVSDVLGTIKKKHAPLVGKHIKTS